MYYYEWVNLMNDRNDKTFNNFKVKSDIEREYTLSY